MGNKKITLLTDGIYPFVMGGMQKHSYYLTKYLAQNKVFVELYHCVPQDKPLVGKLEGFTNDELKYINHYCFHFPVEMLCIASLPGHYVRENKILSKQYLNHFLKQKQSNKDQIIYAQGFAGWAFIVKKKKGRTLPNISVNFHGLEMFQKAPSLHVKLEHLLLRNAVKYNVRNADIAISLGGKLTGILRKIRAKRIIKQGIGIEKTWLFDNLEKNNTESNKIKFVFIGRYERRKGIEELSTAIEELDLEIQNAESHFIGPIPDSKKINNTDIIYHGQISEEEKIKTILQDSDVLISPSWSEGMPTVILEAMASGCAIIATNVGAVSEQVDENNGWLIEAGNIKQLKEAILSAIETSDEKLLEKKRSSVEKIKHGFLWDDVVKKTIRELIKD